MNSLDIQRLEHIQTQCRDILFYMMLCEHTFDRFEGSAYVQDVRIALYHIGELAERIEPEAPPTFWQEACAWSVFRTTPPDRVDCRALWTAAQNTIPDLLQYCEQIKMKQ